MPSCIKIVCLPPTPSRLMSRNHIIITSTKKKVEKNNTVMDPRLKKKIVLNKKEYKTKENKNAHGDFPKKLKSEYFLIKKVNNDTKVF